MRQAELSRTALFGGCGARRQRLAGRVKQYREDRAFAWLGGDGELATMAVEDVLDDGEPKSGTPLLAARSHIYAVEALGEPGQMLWRDSRPLIDHGDGIASGLPADRGCLLGFQANLGAFCAVADNTDFRRSKDSSKVEGRPSDREWSCTMTFSSSGDKESSATIERLC